MIDWLTETMNFSNLTWTDVVLGLAMFLVAFIGSLVAIGFILVMLPSSYFSDSSARDAQRRHPVLRWTKIIAKNLLGAVMILLGAVLSLPGLPGQGFLMIAIGVMLLDFPGKRRLARWLLGRPRVVKSVNRLRQRFGKPPLMMDQPKNRIVPRDKAVAV